MSVSLCLILSGVTVGIGVLALYVGSRDSTGSMAIKVGGSFITVIGCLGLIACFLAG